MASLKSSNKQPCVMHSKEGEMLSSSQFYQSKSPMFKNQKLPFCKECMVQYLTYDLEGNELTSDKSKRNFIHLCRIGDIYFDNVVFERIRQTKKSPKRWLGEYLKQINTLAQFKDLTYSDYEPILIPGEYIENEDGVKESLISDTDKHMWGDERQIWEYEMLNDVYDEYGKIAKSAYGGMTTNMKLAVKSYAMNRVEIEKQQRMGIDKPSDLKQLHDFGQKTLESAGLTHKQIQEREDTGEESMGFWIKHIEEDEPIPSGFDLFGEEDEIGLTVKAMSGHLADMMGIPNMFDAETKEFKEKYGVRENANE